MARKVQDNSTRLSPIIDLESPSTRPRSRDQAAEVDGRWEAEIFVGKGASAEDLVLVSSPEPLFSGHLLAPEIRASDSLPLPPTPAEKRLYSQLHRPAGEQRGDFSQSEAAAIQSFPQTTARSPAFLGQS